MQLYNDIRKPVILLCYGSSDIDNDGDQDILVVMGGAYEVNVFFISVCINPYQGVNN